MKAQVLPPCRRYDKLQCRGRCCLRRWRCCLGSRHISGWIGCRPWGGIGGQDQWRARWLTEVEVAQKAAEPGRVFAHVGPWVRAAVGIRIESLPAEEVVLDELQVSIVAELLMVDVSGPRIWADHQAGHPQAVAILVDVWRHDVIVEAAPIVPREKDSGVVPTRTAHYRVDQRRHIGLPIRDKRVRMF